MSDTAVWSILWMKCKPVEGDFTDVVVVAGWQCEGKTTLNGQCEFPLPESDFTPYPELTQDQVLSWCWENGVDQTTIETAANQPVDPPAPVLVELPLPWASS